MRARFDYYWNIVNASFWFLPGLLILFAVMIAVLSIYLDNTPLGKWMQSSSFVYQLRPDGARAVLSTVAGAMMTTASLVFSLTLVVLTVATGQMGPRIIDRFMRDRLNQVVLGAFIGTFCFALFVSITVTGGDNVSVPLFSLSLAVVAAISSLVLLIVYVHHIARSIQSDNVISDLGNRLKEAIARTFPERTDRVEAAAPAVDEPLGRPFNVRAGLSGYIQTIDVDGLVELAAENNLLIEMRCRQGKYLIEPGTIARVWGRETFEAAWGDRVRACLIMGDKRTDLEDIELAFRNVAEIAERALSPGINDFYTPMAALDHLADAVSTIMDRDMPERVRRDGTGLPRVLLDLPDFKQIMDVAFHDLWQCAKDNAAVLHHMIDNLTSLAGCARNETHFAAIRAYAGLLRRSIDRYIQEPFDVERLRLQMAGFDEVLADRRKDETLPADALLQ
ncbi:MAG: DUF2254 domain-containing protein [Geminicoccaceae bacterium]|nr:DUF2254 domain-containing protein [Geminicoccaceae bacterium]